MTMLTDNELAQIREDVLGLLPDTCRIERATVTNSNGYVTETWGTAVASAACRFDIDFSTRSEVLISEREAGISPYLVTFPYDADIRDGDRLVYDGGTYQVLKLWTAQSSHFVRRARASIIQGG